MIEQQKNRIAFGYVWAVGAIDVTLFVGLLYRAFFNDPNPFLAVVALILFSLISIPVVVLSSVIPFVIVAAIGENFSIRSVWYYLIGGILIGCLLTPVFTMFVRGSGFTIAVAPASFNDMMAVAPITAALGTIGGLVFWWRSGRRAGPDNTVN